MMLVEHLRVCHMVNQPRSVYANSWSFLSLHLVPAFQYKDAILVDTGYFEVA